jgi:hypothetical protein
MIFSDAAAMLTLPAFLICDLAKDRTAHPGLVLTFGDFGSTGNFGNPFLMRVHPR